MEFFTPGFWGFATATMLPILGGVGWLVKYLLNRKTETEREADDLNARLVTRSEEAAECKVKIVYLEARNEELEERCKELTWELRHKGEA